MSGLAITLGSLVSERISRSRVLEKYGLDYCCGGHMPLDEACREKGVDAQEVLDALTAADANDAPEDKADWRQATLTELADHIEATHHAYLKQEFPRLSELSAKVASVHSENHPEMVEVAQAFAALVNELTNHMSKEEQVLFPVIRQMEAGGQADFHCGSVAAPIGVMEQEHIMAGQALINLRSLTNEYQAPEDGCSSYQALYAALAELEYDLHQHIHKENSILFPRAIAMEQKLMQG